MVGVNILMDTCKLGFFILGILTNAQLQKSLGIFSQSGGCDDTGMEINKYVSGDKEANELINEWLKIYHDMPKHLAMKWLEDRGFKPA